MGKEWGDGDLVEVEWRICRFSRAAFRNPTNQDQAYVFCETMCFLMEGTPDTVLPNRIVGATEPKLTIQEWQSLKRLNHIFIDAVWPIPGSTMAHFFGLGEYSRVNVETQETWGPVKMQDHWASLREAGFHVVDEVLPHPILDDQAYFFSGEHYALIKVDHLDPLHDGGHIIHGPKVITDDWAALRKAGFSTIDMVLPWSEGKAYFFCGHEYVLIDVSPGTTNDRIYNTSRSVCDNWPALHQARFF